MPESPDSLPVQGPTNKTILLVDDDPVVRGLMASVLRGAGYTVLQSTNGEETLELLENHSRPIDLLITDMIMPRIGGNELASRLQANYPALRIIFCSGHPKEEVLHQAPTQSTPPFLHKPFSPATLLESVREALAF